MTPLVILGIAFVLTVLSNLLVMVGMTIWYYEKEGATTAYRPDLWKFFDPEARTRSLREKISLLMKLFVPSICGFTHAFFSWLVPFVAEEVGIELAKLIEELRSGVKYEDLKGFTYAL